MDEKGRKLLGKGTVEHSEGLARVSGEKLAEDPASSHPAKMQGDFDIMPHESHFVVPLRSLVGSLLGSLFFAAGFENDFAVSALFVACLVVGLATGGAFVVDDTGVGVDKKVVASIFSISKPKNTPNPRTTHPSAHTSLFQQITQVQPVSQVEPV